MAVTHAAHPPSGIHIVNPVVLSVRRRVVTLHPPAPANLYINGNFVAVHRLSDGIIVVRFPRPSGRKPDLTLSIQY